MTSSMERFAETSQSGTGPVTISELKKIKFCRLSQTEKVALKQRGRSTPQLSMSQDSEYKGEVKVLLLTVKLILVI